MLDVTGFQEVVAICRTADIAGLQTGSLMTLGRRLLSDSDVRAVTGERRYLVDTRRQEGVGKT